MDTPQEQFGLKLQPTERVCSSAGLGELLPLAACAGTVPEGWAVYRVQSCVGKVLGELRPVVSPHRISWGRTASYEREPMWSKGLEWPCRSSRDKVLWTDCSLHSPALLGRRR